MAKVRQEVIEMGNLGRLPNERDPDMRLLEEFDKLHRAVTPPVTDDEARVLVGLLGDDGSFGIAASIMHLIETAPGWPLEDCLTDVENEWIAEMRRRCIRSGRLPAV